MSWRSILMKFRISSQWYLWTC